MKIKHWQGYGCVNARRIRKDENTLVIEVRGEHEYGLVREDKQDVFYWLVKRFDKNRTDWFEIADIEIEEDTAKNPNAYRGYDDIVTYTIHFRKKGDF